MPCTGNTSSQRQGIDRVIHLANGQTIYIDEKKRASVYPDILLEYISVDKTGALGMIDSGEVERQLSALCLWRDNGETMASQSHTDNAYGVE
jgi:hypothetical protein